MKNENKLENEINLKKSIGMANKAEAENENDSKNEKDLKTPIVKKIVGLYQKNRNFGFVIPDDKRICATDIFISKNKNMKAKNNQKVVVEITKEPTKNRKAEGRIVQVLGNVNEAGIDVLSIIKEFDLPYEFPKKVLKEAKEVSKEKIKLKNRLDLRDEKIFTIDGEDAKDLDDAVNVKKNSDGTYTLGVHIADVSHYVKEGSMLDKEAIKRGTSVYMLDRVIPMLPKELSNGACSLNHNEDRYAISVIMKINKKGEVIDHKIEKSVINVTKRMNYHEVYAIIEGKNAIENEKIIEEKNVIGSDEITEDNTRKLKGNKCMKGDNTSANNQCTFNNDKLIANNKSKIEENSDFIYNNENAGKNKFKTREYVERVLKENQNYIKHFKLMKELAIILKNRRMKNGYLSLDIPESEITLDKNGKAIDVKPYETTFANEIIEQFMLTANETVAETFYWLNAPFIYRVHEKPDEDKIVELNKSLFNFGYRIKGKKDDIKPKAFSEILEDVKGKEEEGVVSNLILRTLKIARYESENKGHFGIASKYYCHFTSPIRRYPDLFIHRVISSYLESNYNVPQKTIERYELEAPNYAIKSSDAEQVATKAERESEKLKKAEYMESKIGEEYEGVVSSITNFGMFVELPNTVEGLVRFEDIDGDYYDYNEKTKELIGQRSKKIFKLGDKVKVKVKYASKIKKIVDFSISN